jgi:signal recognition particle subunit SEC65
LAIQAPRLDEIDEAAKRLSLEEESIPGKSRPRLWWDKGGYATVAKNGSKTSILRALAAEIRKIRATKIGEEQHKH